MFVYEKRLEYPIKVKNPNPKLAAVIISQYGGPYSNRLRKSRSKTAPAFTIHRVASPGKAISGPRPR